MANSSLRSRAYKAGGMYRLFMEIMDLCPYLGGTHRQYTYLYLCRIALGWCKAADRYRECTSDDSKTLYKPTADHYANRIAGILDALEMLVHAREENPLLATRKGKQLIRELEAFRGPNPQLDGPTERRGTAHGGSDSKARGKRS